MLIYSEFLTHFIFFQSPSLGIVAQGPSLSDGLGERKALFSKECACFKLVASSELLGDYEDAQRWRRTGLCFFLFREKRDAEEEFAFFLKVV